jgi:TRAP-type C4-dicarboxylate transport system permease small subunit
MSAVSQRPGPSLVASGRTRWSSATFDLLNITGSVWIVILMLAICLDVIGRTTLARPIDGIAEFSALSIVCIVFMQLPDAIASRRLTRADALLARLMQSHPAFGRWIETLWTGLGAAVFAAVAYSAAVPLARAWQRGEFIGVEGIFTFPSWIVWAMIEAGSVMACVAYAIRLRSAQPTTAEVGHV